MKWKYSTSLENIGKYLILLSVVFRQQDNIRNCILLFYETVIVFCNILRYSPIIRERSLSYKKRKDSLERRAWKDEP